MIKSYFFQGVSEYQLEFDKDYVMDMLITQNIQKLYEPEEYGGIEMKFSNNELIEILGFDDLGNKYNIDLSILKFKLNPDFGLSKKRLNLIPTKRGNFDLFGKFDQSIIIPEMKGDYTVNYIGKISNKLVNWLPFEEIYFFCPEFLKGVLYVDYSNPLYPKYLNNEVIEKVNFPKKNRFILKEFNKVSFNIQLEVNDSETLGLIGVPSWIQNPEIPKCPKTNKPMKFIIQLDASEYKYQLGKTENDFDYEPIIYIFMEPKSKIIAYVLQT